MSAILLNSQIVHYEVLGRGRPIIFLHGWVGSWRYWIPTMQVASTSYRAYALDLWGFGETAHTEERYTLNEQATLIRYFLEQMGMIKVALVGHGLGALVAMEFAGRDPQSVDRMMLVNCPLMTGMLNPRLGSASPTELADWLLDRTPETEAARADAPKADPKAIAASITSMQSNGLLDKISTVRTPSLYVHGLNDLAITSPTREQADEILPSYHATQITFDDAGHFPMLQDSARFNRLLTDFLSLQSGASPKDLQLKEEWKRRVR